MRQTWGISVFRIKQCDDGRLQAIPELETSYDAWMRDNLGGLDRDEISALEECRPIRIGGGSAPRFTVVPWERSVT